MKKLRNVLAIALALATVLQFNIFAYATTTTKSKYTGLTYTHNSRFDSYKKLNVIDVSYHNGAIDFNKIKAAGVDGVFIRIGYTAYRADKFSLNYDKNYKTYMKDAFKAGLKIGTYWYSQALDTTESKAEANKMLLGISSAMTELADVPLEISLPVVMDYEFAGVSSGRLDSKFRTVSASNKSKMTANANAFIKVVKDAGYIPSVYASKSFFEDHMNYANIDASCQNWLAHYATKTSYAGEYKYWQYSSEGKIAGTESTYVDCNFVYLASGEALGNNFTVEPISNCVYTGEAQQPVPVVLAGDKQLVAGLDFAYSFKNNIKYGKASVIITGVNDYASYPKKTEYFYIVPQKATGLVVNSTTTSTATISWEPVKDATGYSIQAYRSGKWVEQGITPETTYTIKNLNSASNYKIRVAGYVEVGSVRCVGQYSTGVYATTIPKKIKASSTTTASTIKLSWDKEKYCTGYYVYRFNYDKNAYEKLVTLENPDIDSYDLSGLKPNTKYLFRVQAYKVKKADGKIVTGTRSDKCYAYTKPATPKISSIKSPKSKTIKLTWDKVACSGYQIRWSTNSKLNSDYVTTTAGSKTIEKTIKTSKNKRYYYVKIRAYKIRDDKKYYSSWSSVKKVYVK